MESLRCAGTNRVPMIGPIREGETRKRVTVGCPVRGTVSTFYRMCDDYSDDEGAAFLPACDAHADHSHPYYYGDREDVWIDVMGGGDEFDPDPSADDLDRFAMTVPACEIDVQLDDLSPCRRCDLPSPASSVEAAYPGARCDRCVWTAAQLAAESMWERGDAHWVLAADDPTQMVLAERPVPVMTNNTKG